MNKPSRDGTAIIQEAREIVRSGRSVLRSGLLSTGAREWRRAVMMVSSGNKWCPALAIALIVPYYTPYNIPRIIRRFQLCGSSHLPVLGVQEVMGTAVSRGTWRRLLRRFSLLRSQGVESDRLQESHDRSIKKRILRSLSRVAANSESLA